MPRKTRRVPSTPPANPRPSWPGYVVAALLAAALGSGATYLALRPALTRLLRPVH